MKPVFVVIGAALVTLVGIKVATTLTGGPTDRQLIDRAVKQALEDSRQSKAGSVVDLLSKNLTVNEQATPSDVREVTKFIRASRPDVTLENPVPLVTGDEARIVSPATLKASILGQTLERRMGEVTLILRREDDKEWFLIPKKAWKLTEVRVPETSVADLLNPGF